MHTKSRLRQWGRGQGEAEAVFLRPRQANEILRQLAWGWDIRIFCLKAASRQGISSRTRSLQKPDVSYTINVLKMVPNLGHHPMGVWCNLGRKLLNYKWYAKKWIFCPIVQNFLLVSEYFQHKIFQPQWPLPIALIIWGLWPPNIFGDWKYASPLSAPCL